VAYRGKTFQVAGDPLGGQAVSRSASGIGSTVNRQPCSSLVTIQPPGTACQGWSAIQASNPWSLGQSQRRSRTRAAASVKAPLLTQYGQDAWQTLALEPLQRRSI